MQTKLIRLDMENIAGLDKLRRKHDSYNDVIRDLISNRGIEAKCKQSVYIPEKVNKRPQPTLNNVKEKLEAVGLTFQGNRIVNPPGVPVQTQPAEYIPWYNPALHKTGDKVRMRDRSGRVTVQIVPELDADGNPIQS